MNVLHGHLEPIEAPGLWDLNLGHEPLSEVLKNDSVGSSEESKHVLDEVLLILVELAPVFQILTQIDLFGGPEASHLVLVHLPDIVVMNWKNDEPVGVLVKDWLWELTLSLVLRGRLLSWTNSLLDSTALTMGLMNEL